SRARIQVEHRGSREVDARREHVEQRFAYPIGRRPSPGARHRDSPAAERAGDYPGQLTTTSRSPPSTCAVAETATRLTLPALGAVIAASIFIASMVAIVCPASTVASTDTATVTTPANGAATWSGFDWSAFSAAGTSAATLRSRTTTGRSWPFRMHITVRMPRS